MDRMLFLLWCSGEDQVADMATKSLGRKLFEKLWSQISPKDSFWKREAVQVFDLSSHGG